MSGLASGVTAIAAGAVHTCALMTGGGVKCWGDNHFGQLGDGTTTSHATPVDVLGLENDGVVTAITAGGSHTCALTTGSGVKCWGYNTDGQLGNDSTTNSPTPVPVSGLGSGVVTAIAAGHNHTCALTTGGGVKCWGYNGSGQLGNGSTTGSPTPVYVFGLENGGVTAIAADSGHTCALTTGGAVQCWGSNGYGALGNDSTTDSPTPVVVDGLGNFVVTAIAASWGHTCALTMNDGVKCWGYNGSGQLGDGSTDNQATPVGVVGLTNVEVTAIAAGYSHTCALTTDGGIKCWGLNSYGQLGDGTGTDSPTPVDVVGLTNVEMTAITAGVGHTCALTTGGGVKCWGLNSQGQLGDGAGWTPVDVAGFGGQNCSAPSGLNTCALQPGDILLKAGPASGVCSALNKTILKLGGTYFTHTALYLGQVAAPGGDPNDIRPRIVEAQGSVPQNPDDEVWETWLTDTQFWSGECLTDWAVVRPNTTQAAKSAAITYARQKAAEAGVVFDLMASKEDPKEFYSSKLAWKAYKDGFSGGPDLETDRSITNHTFSAQWVTPDDLYYGSPPVDSKDITWDQRIRRGFFWI